MKVLFFVTDLYGNLEIVVSKVYSDTPWFLLSRFVFRILTVSGELRVPCYTQKKPFSTLTETLTVFSYLKEKCSVDTGQLLGTN